MVLATYLILFLLTGSLILPLKAVVLNLLSIGASFGALVWIFQQGHLSGQLGFTAQSIDPSTPIILFSIVFGMSMDYEVLLVSRIHEEYLRTRDNTAAVARGLELPPHHRRGRHHGRGLPLLRAGPAHLQPDASAGDVGSRRSCARHLPIGTQSASRRWG